MNNMNKMACIAGALSLGLTHLCRAEGAKPGTEYPAMISERALEYASAITCGDESLEPSFVLPLTPYDTTSEFLDAQFVVLWVGDIGCSGGSGTTMLHLTTVAYRRGGLGGEVAYVEPALSVPVIEFAAPAQVEAVVTNTQNTITFDAKEWSRNDPSCCPSIPVRFTLQRNQSGHWRRAK